MIDHLIVIRRKQLDEQTHAEQVKKLVDSFGADGFQTRLALRGSGLAIMRPGPDNSVDEMAAELGRMGYACAIVPTRRPRVAAHIVRHFELGDDGILLSGPFGERRFPKGAKVVAVLAGMERSLIGKLMRRSVYTKGKVTTLAEAEKLAAILQAGPILDLYVFPDGFDPNAETIAPLRLRPGGFDPKSLGDRAASTARENIRRLIEIAREMAGEFHLELDFGLCQLPGCRFDSSGTEQAHEHNLDQLTAFGWYLQHVHAATPQRGANALEADAEADGRQAAAREAADLAAHTDDFLPPPPPVHQPSWYKARPWWEFVVGGIYALWLIGFPALAEVLKSDASRALFHWGFERGFFFLLSAGVLAHGSFHFLRKKRWMDNTPTSKARSAAMGMVEIKGRVRRAYNVIAPMSQMPCVYYRLRRFERRRGRNGEQYWAQTSVSTSGGVPFELYDETGFVTVDPTGATIKTSIERTTTDAGNMLIGHDPALGDGDTKYIEEILPEGTEVYVLGFAEPGQSAQQPLRQRVTEKLRLIKQNKQKLMRYDANDDGFIDEREWDAARGDIEREVMRDALGNEVSRPMGGPPAVIKKPPISGIPFVISDRGEERLVRWSGVYAIALFVAAVGSLLWGLGALLS